MKSNRGYECDAPAPCRATFSLRLTDRPAARARPQVPAPDKSPLLADWSERAGTGARAASHPRHCPRQLTDCLHLHGSRLARCSAEHRVVSTMLASNGASI